MSVFNGFRRLPTVYFGRVCAVYSWKQNERPTRCFSISNRCKFCNLCSKSKHGCCTCSLQIRHQNISTLKGYARPVSHGDVRSMTKGEWQERLTPEQFSVCREQCTEPPFSGVFNSHYEAGTYTCVCCGEALFSSESKYDSGTGWPSFNDSYKQEKGLSNIIERPENSVDASTFRTEVICKKCDSHLGHVFDDGPPPAGKRYCINSAALGFEPTSKN